MAAKIVLLLHQQHLRPRLRRGDGRGHPGRTSPGDEHIGVSVTLVEVLVGRLGGNHAARREAAQDSPVRGPKASLTDFTSKRSEGHTFWGLTTIPCSTRRCAPLTFGSLPTCSMQPGSRKLAVKSPRGRWYLKLREKIFSPQAARAETMVSPS